MDQFAYLYAGLLIALLTIAVPLAAGYLCYVRRVIDELTAVAAVGIVAMAVCVLVGIGLYP